MSDQALNHAIDVFQIINAIINNIEDGIIVDYVKVEQKPMFVDISKVKFGTPIKRRLSVGPSHDIRKYMLKRK